MCSFFLNTQVSTPLKIVKHSESLNICMFIEHLLQTRTSALPISWVHTREVKWAIELEFSSGG